MDLADDAHPPAAPVPSSVRIACRLVWTVIALTGLTALLTIVLHDQLVSTWSKGKSADLTPPAFVPVALTLFVVVAAFGWVLVVFFRNGHAWARWVLAALVLFAGFASVQGLDRDLPTTFVVLTVVTRLVSVALLVFLFHKDTNAYLRGSADASP